MAASIAYVSNATDTANRTLYTFVSQNLGTPAADRKIIVAVKVNGTLSNLIQSVSIGGVTATLAIKDQTAAGQDVGIYIASVPSGTTGDIVVDPGNTPSGCDIWWWETHGLTSNVATDTGSSNANPQTYDLDVVAGGVAVAIAANDSTTATWTNLTEDYDGAVDGGDKGSVAHAAFNATQTNLTISCQWVTPGTQTRMVVASFPGAISASPSATPSSSVSSSLSPSPSNSPSSSISLSPSSSPSASQSPSSSVSKSPSASQSPSASTSASPSPGSSPSLSPSASLSQSPSSSISLSPSPSSSVSASTSISISPSPSSSASPSAATWFNETKHASSWVNQIKI
jgi:hypothetical protein